MENIYSRFKMMDKWDKRLKFFRFERGYDGHVSDSDRLTFKLKYYGQDELLKIFDNLKIAYEIYKTEPPQPEPAKRYPYAEFMKFPSLVPETKWVKQPGDQVINSVKVRVWCTEDTIEFTIRPSKENKYELVETDFENAEKIEKMFLNYGEQIKTSG
jgi:hypothetical protein